MTLDEFLEEWNNPHDRLLVHTSGSTGKPKAMWVEKKRMLNSARLTCDFLNLHEGDTALLCMPLDYIAGKMMVVRAIERKLKLISVAPSNHPLESVNEDIAFAAMVPSQVYCSLNNPKLQKIRNLIIGGGAVSRQLESALKDFPNAVWSTYGMTETLSHIAMRRLNGPDHSEWYKPLNSVTISLDNDSCLIIDAPMVHEGILTTNDIAEINDEGLFRIKGRKDNVICSGGIKLQIEEIEEKLSPHIGKAFCISKRKDEKFGEVAVMLIEGEGDKNDIEDICRTVLDKYEIPKDIVFVKNIPITETGKINRQEAVNLFL